MMRSLNSAVAGLRTHQTKMDVIGNNIANVNTYGFKASRVTFSDVYYQTTSGGTAPTNIQGARAGGVNPTQIGYGSQIATIDVLNGPTGAATTNRALDVYLTGEGYLVSKKGDETFYTRLGNIKFDPHGNLVDHTGNILQGFNLTPTGGMTNIIYAANPEYDSEVGNIKDAMEKLQKALTDLTAVPTPVAEGDPGYSAYLAAVKLRNEQLASIEGYYKQVVDTTGLLEDTALFATGGAGETPLADLKAAYDAAVAADFGGATKNITALAAAVTAMQGLAYSTEPKEIPTAAKEQRDNDYNPLKWNLDINPENEYGEGSLSNITLGPDVNVLSILTNISVDATGRITGTLSKDYYSNRYGFQFFANEVYQIGQLAMANFGNAEGLVEAGNSYLKIGANSGEATYVVPGKNGTGELKAGYLEMSNVDIAQEFTDMITTQRGFQANSRIITVSDEMLQELVNLKR